MKVTDVLALFLLSALWGATALLVRFVSQDFGVLFLTEARMIIGAIAVTVYSLFRERNFRLVARPWHSFVMGLINAAVPISLSAFAATRLPTGFANVLFAPTPLITAIIGVIWLKDKITPKQIIGCIMGIAGVAVLVGWVSFELDASVISGILAAFGSVLSYSIATNFAKKNFKSSLPIQTTRGQLIMAAVLLSPFLIMDFPQHAPSLGTILFVIAFGLVSTAFGFLLFFNLMSRIGAARTQVVALLIPCFGVLWGWLFRGEAITWNVLAGLAIVLTSITLVTDIKLR